MSAVHLPRRAAWLALALGIALGTLAFLLVIPSPPEPGPGERIAVPWHTSTRLTVVDVNWVSPDVVEIVTRRDSKTGTTFTRRRIDCRRREAVRLGQGLTEAEARTAAAGEAAPAAIAENTIPFHVAAWACHWAVK
jgi:hypothetical protein